VTLACAVRAHRLAGDPDLADDHIASCLRCQVEAVRYRTLVHRLAALRSEIVEAPPGFVSLVKPGLGNAPPVPKKATGIETAVAAAGLVAVAGAVALWRRTLSA
jgi:hypothetical protein